MQGPSGALVAVAQHGEVRPWDHAVEGSVRRAEQAVRGEASYHHVDQSTLAIRLRIVRVSLVSAELSLLFHGHGFVDNATNDCSSS